MTCPDKNPAITILDIMIVAANYAIDCIFTDCDAKAANDIVSNILVDTKL